MDLRWWICYRDTGLLHSRRRWHGTHVPNNSFCSRVSNAQHCDTYFGLNHRFFAQGFGTPLFSLHAGSSMRRQTRMSGDRSMLPISLLARLASTRDQANQISSPSHTDPIPAPTIQSHMSSLPTLVLICRSPWTSSVQRRSQDGRSARDLKEGSHILDRILRSQRVTWCIGFGHDTRRVDI